MRLEHVGQSHNYAIEPETEAMGGTTCLVRVTYHEDDGMSLKCLVGVNRKDS